MEDNGDAFTSYFHHHTHRLGVTAAAATTSSNVADIFSLSPQQPPPPPSPLPEPFGPGLRHFPHAGVSGIPAGAPVKRKRGRPRRYGPSAAAADIAVTLAPSTGSPYVRKPQTDSLGKRGQGFTPHAISVATGEDVVQKIMSLMEKSNRAVCVISASGSVCSVSLRRPSAVEGVVAFEGPFEIISLAGSFLFAENRGTSSRVGGMSICLSNCSGHVIGGRLCGPLIAAGSVQVIAASFMASTDQEDITSNAKDFSSSKLLSTPESIGSQLVQPSSSQFSDSLGRITNFGGTDYHPIVGGENNRALHFHGIHADSPFPRIWEEGKSVDNDYLRKLEMESEFKSRFSSKF